MINLDFYRDGKENWKELSYSEAHSEDRGSYDRNEKSRYAALIELQYNFKKGDEQLIRFLFEQEIVARENDSFQGIGDALWLGAYLLAKFRKPEDIPLFHRAKFANFDTGCGFDREFIYCALREETEDYVFKNYPEIYEDIKDCFSFLDMDAWWSHTSKRFPDSETEESLLELYQRNIYFENYDQAKSYLEQWKQREPESKQKENTLKYAYTELGEYAKAVEILKREIGEKETNWDRASYFRDLLSLYTKMKEPKEGLDVIKSINKEFKRFNDWRDVGLGRMAIHEAFEYALATEDLEIAKQSFKIAHSWFKKMKSIAYVGLEAGWKAAERCGFTWIAIMYKNLAIKERQRIDSM